MDNLSHSLTGLALARAGLNRRIPRGTLLMMIAANIPDIDMVSLIEGPVRNLEVHRGYTHSLLFTPVMAAAAVGLTALFARKRLPWMRAWVCAFAGVLSHLLLDWSMSYGIRLLLPFSERWLALDLFSLFDYVILAVLALAAVAPALNRLVSDEIGDRQPGGRGLAILALCFFAAYGGFRALMHNRALAQLESRIYDEALGGPPLRMAAFASPGNPFLWHGVVEGEHAYRLYQVYSYGNFDPDSGNLLYKAHWTPTLKYVSSIAPFQYFLYFARFPYWQEEPDSTKEGHKIVTLSDLRFGSPGESFFTIRAYTDAAGHLNELSVAGSKPKPAR